jgi:hypothetical protein
VHFALADLLVDLVQNAVASGSSHIVIVWDESDRAIRASVTDDGKGMSDEERSLAVDPFYTDGKKHPQRAVGLGLPFLKQTAESVGGQFYLDSAPGDGTTVGFQVPADHIDLPPRGDLISAFVFALADKTAEVEITRIRDEKRYTVRKSDVVEILGGLETVEQLGLLQQYVESQEEDVWQR